MQLFFSASTKGFYDTDIHAPYQIPSDAVEISIEEHVRLFNGQAEGKLITAGANGYPILADYPPPTMDEVREMRAVLLKQMDEVVSNPLRWSSFSEEQKIAWGVYRQKLLDITKQEFTGFPDKPEI